ncbi:probable serine/threonine-protein kinase DDB_G0278901 [Lolium rigidum]|uniref:probable serine/threonine-protein kinase DDB_G0278901 n=1 Tax=Lolium rigidum TaxID=89674 RepID=UPI001F5CD14C|nr:probable serine/threonine-protein kinase DDB_G0278901 [Lolium rigidum]
MASFLRARYYDRCGDTTTILLKPNAGDDVFRCLFASPIPIASTRKQEADHKPFLRRLQEWGSGSGRGDRRSAGAPRPPSRKNGGQGVDAHAAGVTHYDVKARNVLIGADGRAMIADFGCARRTGSIAGHRVTGTPAFMAPEAARGEAQGPAVDIWALGCTVIEMATGAAPWQRFASTVATLHHVAFSGESPELPCWLSDQGKDFLGRCLLQDAAERWTAEQLLDHEFVVAAAVSSSSSVPGIAEKGMFVSPKSVLDQALWEDDDDTTADTATAGPIGRVRALAAGAPDWTWDASWITVHSSGTSGDDDNPAMSPDTDADSDSPAGSSSTGRAAKAGASSSQASHAGGDCYDGTGSCNGERRDNGNHVITDCTLPITITSNMFVPAGCPSLPLPLLFFFLLFVSPIGATPLFRTAFRSVWVRDDLRIRNRLRFL